MQVDETLNPKKLAHTQSFENMAYICRGEMPAEEAVQLYTNGHWKVPAGLLAEVEHFARLVPRLPLFSNPSVRRHIVPVNY
jgi:hypothetical protein